MDFSAWMRRAGRGEGTRLAKVVGVSKQTVSQVLCGTLRASERVAVGISRATGGVVSADEVREHYFVTIPLRIPRAAMSELRGGVSLRCSVMVPDDVCGVGVE